jgi:anti-anti-sigma regulatory factor
MSRKKPLMSHDPLEDVVADGPEPNDREVDEAADAAEAGGVVALEANFTIAEVAGQRDRLAAAVVPGGELLVDAGELEMIDGAALQLLAAVANECRARACRLTWRNVPETLRRNAAVMGLEEALGLHAEPA